MSILTERAPALASIPFCSNILYTVATCKKDFAKSNNLREKQTHAFNYNIYSLKLKNLRNCFGGSCLNKNKKLLLDYLDRFNLIGRSNLYNITS